MTSCIACPASAAHLHHVIYAQQLRRHTALQTGALVRDERNLVPMCIPCHARQHSGFKRLPLTLLPDTVFEFAAEVMGAGPAYEYLLARYGSPDPRSASLLDGVA